jgi:hypothetical protein
MTRSPATSSEPPISVTSSPGNESSRPTNQGRRESFSWMSPPGVHPGVAEFCVDKADTSPDYVVPHDLSDPRPEQLLGSSRSAWRPVHGVQASQVRIECHRCVVHLWILAARAAGLMWFR